MIRYVTRQKTRSEEQLERLRAHAATGRRGAAERIEEYAAALVTEMTALYGGEFRAQIDLQAGFVMVVRR